MPLTLAQMHALLADNTVRDITAAEVRDVVTALHTAGAAVFADANSTAVAIHSVTDVSVFSVNVIDIVAGDLLEVEWWGFSRNATGGNRTLTLTLDFDGAFDMEWSFTSMSQVQHVSMSARLVVHASNLATLNMIGTQPIQSAVGVMYVVADTTGHDKAGYDTTTQDLTGTTAVSLNARSSDTTATQELTVLGMTIRKLTST